MQRIAEVYITDYAPPRMGFLVVAGSHRQGQASG